MREIININRNDAVRVILDDLSKDKVVVLSGGFGSGKTTLLGKIASNLELSVNHVSEIDDPLGVGYGKLPSGDSILLDEVSSNMPQKIRSLEASYDRAVVATHYFNIGEAYAEYLTGKKSVVYHLRS